MLFLSHEQREVFSRMFLPLRHWTARLSCLPPPSGSVSLPRPTYSRGTACHALPVRTVLHHPVRQANFSPPSPSCRCRAHQDSYPAVCPHRTPFLPSLPAR